MLAFHAGVALERMGSGARRSRRSELGLRYSTYRKRLRALCDTEKWTKFAHPSPRHAAADFRMPWLHMRRRARLHRQRQWALRANTGPATARPMHRTHRGPRGGWTRTGPSPRRLGHSIGIVTRTR